MEKRVKIIFLAFVVLAAALMGRTGYIQLMGHQELSAAAAMQQQILLEGADTRGVIYDRYGTPLAGAYQEYIYIIKESEFDGETGNALSRLNAVEVDNKGNGYKVFTSSLYDKETGKRLIRNSGAYILKAPRRYTVDQPAVHLIGYVNPADNTGVTGLELLYDGELSLPDRNLSTIADIQGNLLRNYGLVSGDDEELCDGIHTTLDAGLQKAVEASLKQQWWNGAVVVVKADTGQVLASASTPVYDPLKIEEHLESYEGELINKATQGQYPPGSVFKIVVTAAALEKGISPDAVFNCRGSVIVNGHRVSCHTGGDRGHGRLTLTEAFACSCNCAFVKLGREIGAAEIIAMAHKLGLGRQVLDSFPGEAAGAVMTEAESQGTAIANLSIGQGQNLVTPMQVAAMTGVIARGGERKTLSLIKGQEAESSAVISSGTAEEIRQMMRETVDYGTAKAVGAKISAGAKTGSAESSQGGSQVVHGWMTGFIPAEDPEYVITVFAENGRSGSGAAGEVFTEVAEYMYENIIDNEIGL